MKILRKIKYHSPTGNHAKSGRSHGRDAYNYHTATNGATNEEESARKA